MTPLTQALMYAVAVVILLGTLVLFVRQLVRTMREDRAEKAARESADATDQERSAHADGDRPTEAPDADTGGS